jgi:acetyltransferase-like isoleucine patch superfamily enzyme
MNFRNFCKRILIKYYQRIRILLYRGLSTNKDIVGKPHILQPVLFNGLGKIIFDDDVYLGYYPSPCFYDSSIYIEARARESMIKIGKNSYINNGAKIVCDRTLIQIGSDLLIGLNFEVQDSDFHGIHPDKRRQSDYICVPVIIEDNVFIGNNVRILKGVTIGKNSIIANSSVVVSNIPPDSIAGGNPAKVIKSVYA